MISFNSTLLFFTESDSYLETIFKELLIFEDFDRKRKFHKYFQSRWGWIMVHYLLTRQRQGRCGKITSFFDIKGLVKGWRRPCRLRHRQRKVRRPKGHLHRPHFLQRTKPHPCQQSSSSPRTRMSFSLVTTLTWWVWPGSAGRPISSQTSPWYVSHHW